MKKFNCPSCAAEVTFQSNLSVYAVCKYCNSMIVRRDVDVESIGTMAALPDDMSPLQIGTGGFYGDLRFTIIGRMKIGWDDGAWNEWFLYTDDGRRGWLAEAQGSYGVCFELEMPLQPDAEDALTRRLNTFRDQKARAEVNSNIGRAQAMTQLGTYITVDGIKLKIVDIKEATCIGSEGELPFSAPKGRQTLSIDLLGAAGEFGTIEIEGDTQRIYLGHYLGWDELRCQNLRPLEGW